MNARRIIFALTLIGTVGIFGCEAPPQSFTATFADATERVWIGPDYYANRLMDWQLRDGRLECLEGRPAKPMRTVHLLTRALKEEPEALYDRVPGYGIICFNRDDRTITVEAWPRWVDPAAPDAMQYPGWPVTVNQQDNYGRTAAGFLPTLNVQGLENPVAQVIDEATQEPLYTLRIRGQEFQPKVFNANGTYTITVGEPGTEQMQTLTGLTATDDEVREVIF